ncbi:hypothetical protein SK128_017047 [Halocaridina rubra]|uniref:Uncharacterized protein n=1 Tax=Halocaridina rubra TaxID=373956 RepID=A0AAN8X1X4_HALRR
MSKVRPKRGSKTSSSAVQPISLTSGTKELGSSEAHHKIHSSSSETPSLSLSTTSTNFSYEESEILKVFTMFNHSKKKPFRSEEGFGTINPLYNDADELPAPINLPSPIKPTIATSLSMPTMSSLSTTTSGMPSARAETVPTYSRGSFSMTKSTTPNASTPVLPQSRVLSPGRSESEMIKVPTSNPASPDMPTPPNTPSSPPSSTDQSNLQEQLNHPRTSITSDEVTPPINPAMQGKGQLYNILGYPVDLPDIKPCHRNNSCISPEDTKTELYPFSKYPKPFIIDSLKDSEKIIRDLVNLGNGIYDDSEKGNYQTSPVKSEHWETLEDKEKTVTACWNHNLDRPKAEDQYHGKGDLTGKQDSNHANNMSQKKANPKKETSDMQDKEILPNKRKSKNDSYGKAPQEQSKSQRCQNGLVENAATKSATIPVITIHENQRDSLYSHLNIPMIDDDLDSRKPDSSTESSSIDFDCLGTWSCSTKQLWEQQQQVELELQRLWWRSTLQSCNSEEGQPNRPNWNNQSLPLHED